MRIRSRLWGTLRRFYESPPFEPGMIAGKEGLGIERGAGSGSTSLKTSPYISQIVTKSAAMMGPMMTPTTPNMVMPPSVESSTKRSDIFVSLPTSQGLRKLSIVPTTKTTPRAEKNRGERLPDCEQVEHRGDPDDRGADAGENGKRCHRGRPKRGPVDPRDPESESAGRPLRDADHARALDGRAGDRDEARNEAFFVLRRERQVIEDFSQRFAAADQKEERRVEHHEEQEKERHCSARGGRDGTDSERADMATELTELREDLIAVRACRLELGEALDESIERRSASP